MPDTTAAAFAAELRALMRRYGAKVDSWQDYMRDADGDEFPTAPQFFFVFPDGSELAINEDITADPR